MNRYVFGVILAAFAFSVPASHADNWSKTYTIANRADLTVQTDDGDVTIASADQKQIVAHVDTVGYTIGPSQVRIDQSQSGDHVLVSVKLPPMHGHIFGRHEIHVNVTVPRDLDLTVTTGDGAVNVQPVSGHIKLRTGDGSIRADGVRGDIALHTGDGSIDAHNLDGALSASSGDGAIRVAGRFDGLDINTGDGSVEAETSVGSKMTSPWSLHSGDGSINLRVPNDLKAYVDLKTGDGSITLEPVTVEGSVDRSHIRGNLNGGGSELKITSGDGSIHLLKS